jgi:hypothetical protein
MAKDFWFKFYFKDWSDDVKPLSLMARGLLIELIIELRKSNGEIPLDINLISRLSGGLTEQITECITEFKTFGILDFEIRDGKEFLISRKIKKEIAISLINKNNGRKGGNPSLKSVNPSLNPSDNPTDNRTPISNSIFISNSRYSDQYKQTESQVEFGIRMLGVNNLRKHQENLFHLLDAFVVYLDHNKIMKEDFNEFCNHFGNWVVKNGAKLGLKKPAQ